MTDDVNSQTRLHANEVRWLCDPAELGFSSTSELAAETRILGQDDVVEALSFGLNSRIQGNNVFVRGLSGFGRMSLIHQVIEEIAVEGVDTPDRLYIRNFNSPDQPRLFKLSAGTGKAFRNAMDRFAEFAETDLPVYLNSDVVKSKQDHLSTATQERIQKISRPFDEELRAEGLAMVPMQFGQKMVPVILPVIDDTPTQFEDIQQLRLEGKMSDEEHSALMAKVGDYENRLAEMGQEINQIQTAHQQELQNVLVEEARTFVSSTISAIRQDFPEPAVAEFLDEVVNDLINRSLVEGKPTPGSSRNYRVNLVSSHDAGSVCPVISVTNPSLINLVGRIDRELNPGTLVMRSDHLMIKPGALLEADGGFLIIEAQDILTEPGAWTALLRTLKTGLFEMGNSDPFGVWGAPQLKPEPIEVNIKVVLVGDPDTYDLLDTYEPRFNDLFKVLADFSDTIDRDKEGCQAYASVIARLVERDELLHFSASAVTKLIEHGARICSQQGQLTSRFGRIADIAREGSFLAEKEGLELVEARHIQHSIQRSKGRADVPARRFRRLVAQGTVRIDVSGTAVAQINGLAVTSAGLLTYGFPSRVTASIGPGSAGAVNIERESDLSGSAHTKGFLILSGLLRYLLRLQHPMAFSAAIAFEQTYGRIDGDSASGTEFCCLISALTDLPVRQDLAMTGAVDQKGNMLPIGAVCEKIEGFYDACRAVNFTCTQGVLIPRANAPELMLREDIVESIREGEFAVYAIDSIDQALALMLDRPAGKLDDSDYEEGSILSLAQNRAHEYWEIATKNRLPSSSQGIG